MSDPLSDEGLIHEINVKLLKHYKEEEEFWKQRSRNLWLTLGDSNTGYFHAITKIRKAKNRMSVLEDEDGIPQYEEEQISTVICKFYSELFTSNNFDGTQTISKALKPCVTQKQNEDLIKIPTTAEIKEATFSIHADKAPGPDGFSASFFQSNWEVLAPAITKEIQSFFTTGTLAQIINKTYVRLIPKSLDAKRVEDYRTIALCNVYYKIISKLLSLRLKPVLSSIISENQSAFIPGRIISDNVLITHEVLQFLKTSKAVKKCTMAVKTDMSKAYDRVEWKFIEQVLRRLGFHEIWTNWLLQCISTVSYSYLINDTVYGLVQPYRGIRQGDPLSPYLFILCGEVLSGLCRRAEQEGSLYGIKVARGCPRVNHLLFADDTMFFTQASAKSSRALMAILHEYGNASGQQINTAKSAVTFSSKTPPEVKEATKVILVISKEGGLGKYLGLPEHFGRRKKDLFTSVVDRIRQRAVSLSTRRLSRAGKMTMLKSILTAIPTHIISCFQIPVSLCKRIQSVLTRFWWDGPEGNKKMCWVSWDKLTKPKAEGGLGFRDIQLFNQALLAKVAWRIITVPNCLLARILTGKYCKKQSFLNVANPSVASHGWRGILWGRELLKEKLGKSIGNGQTTRVWQDVWISLDDQVKPCGPIKEADLDLTVADLLTTELQWNTKRIKEVLPELEAQIKGLHPSELGAEDKIIWQPLPSGVYSTKSGYYAATLKRLQPTTNPSVPEVNWIKDVWMGSISPKLKLFMWTILHNALPLGENLKRRGLLVNTKCPRCDEEETTMHIFFECDFAKKVWELIPLKNAVHLAAGETLHGAINIFRRLVCLPPTGISGDVLPWVCWILWTSRNNLIFENRRFSPEETATKGLELAREWNLAQNKEKAPKEVPKITHQRNQQKDVGLDSNETIRCTTDAAWEKETQRAGLAWTFEGQGLPDRLQGSAIQHSVSSPLIAEAVAMRSALRKALALGFHKIKAFTDNLTLVRAINSNLQRKEIVGIIHDIHMISSEFASISISHIPRSENFRSDSLAKATLRSSLCFNSALVL
ncbi:uncharacterized protein LOC125588345 [Brassica napus]|uniref:uncharacterized protein LOC125588345 n=1 Tax=Brassica napus TaxID=3708 RepID=UPI00207A171F|nr:uncharacterized protein LOC125588345 [Brassica napus]